MSKHDHCYKCGAKITNRNESERPLECINCIDVDYKLMDHMHCIKCGVKIKKGEVACEQCFFGVSDQAKISPFVVDLSVLEPYKVIKDADIINMDEYRFNQKKAVAVANRKQVQIIYECPCEVERKHKHHWNYEKPLEVMLLCPQCHGAEHRRLNRLKKVSAV